MTGSCKETLPTLVDIELASERIDGYAVRTPLLSSPLLDEILGARIFLKAECLQRTGSFKFRGAYNALSQLPGGSDVVTVSSGNHAQGIAEACRLLSLNATILMPTDAPVNKRERVIRSGAQIVDFDRYSGDRDLLAADLTNELSATLVHPYDNFDVICGQGTAGLEVAEDLTSRNLNCDRLLVCTGGGGLLSGMTIALQSRFPSTKVHCVEPVGYDDYGRSLTSQRIESADFSEVSVCDSILTPSPGHLSFSICRDTVTSGLTVSDDEALSAVSFAFRELNLVVEAGGAVALAALLYDKIDVRDETVVVTLSGGNIDSSILFDALSHHSFEFGSA